MFLWHHSNFFFHHIVTKFNTLHCYKIQTLLISNERTEPSPGDYFCLKVASISAVNSHVSVRKTFVSRESNYTAISVVILIYYFIRMACLISSGLVIICCNGMPEKNAPRLRFENVWNTCTQRRKQHNLWKHELKATRL
jgi:hypothetical protein